MKAVEYDRYGPASELVVRDVPAPEPGARDVVVRVAAFAVNPKDTFLRKGRFRRVTGSRFPKRTGFDFAGTVERVGAAVQGLRPGDRVWGFLDGFAGGAAAELLAVRDTQVGLAPAELSLEEAAAIPLAASTALQALRDDARVRAGQRVCIHGASGGVGTFAVQVARALGARVAAMSSAKNAALCRELGAEETFDYATTPVAALPGPFDAFFDVFGNQSLATTRRLLTPRGTYVTTVPKLASFARHGASLLLPFGRRARVVVVRPRREDLDRLASMVREGRLRAIVDRVYALEEIAAAHEHVETKHTRGKVVVRIGAR